MQAEKIFENSNFIRSRPTVIYFHGLNENSGGDSVKTIVSAFTKANGYNILILDWSELATTFYLTAASNIDKVYCRYKIKIKLLFHMFLLVLVRNRSC